MHALERGDGIDANTILVINCVLCHKVLEPSFDDPIW